MKYNIREMSWYKRRTPTKELTPIEVVEVTDLQLIDNHETHMFVKCDDGETYDLSAKVQYTMKGTWTIHGLNPHGLSVLVDLEEEE